MSGTREKVIKRTGFKQGVLTVVFEQTQRTQHSPEEVSVPCVTLWQRFLFAFANKVVVQGEPCGSFTDITGLKAKFFNTFVVSVWNGRINHAAVDIL